MLRLADPAQPPLQFLAGRRQHKDAHRFRHLLFDLRRTLHVNIEQQIVVARLGFAQEALGRSVIVSEHVGMLQEFIGRQHALKLLPRDEVIFAPVLLAATRRAGSVGDGKIQPRYRPAQLIHQRGFARARGRRDDEYFAHSTFCTCSRAFSISAFIASPSSVTRKPWPAMPAVFDSMVLASRFISCNRKSSFLPASPPVLIKPRKCSTWAFMRTTSSCTSLRSASNAASWATRCGSLAAPRISCSRDSIFSFCQRTMAVRNCSISLAAFSRPCIRWRSSRSMALPSCSRIWLSLAKAFSATASTAASKFPFCAIALLPASAPGRRSTTLRSGSPATPNSSAAARKAST